MSVRTHTQALAPALKDHLNVGIVSRAEGRYVDALEHHLEGQYLLEEGCDLFKAKYHTGLGWTYELLGDLPRASMEYQAGLEYAVSSGDRGEQGTAENNIAFLLIKLNRFDEAHRYLEKAEESFRAVKDTTNIARTLETKASLEAKEFAYRRSVKSVCQSILLLIDGFEQTPLLESLATAERTIRAYRIQLTLESAGTVAKAAKLLGMTRQNLNRILKEEFPELEIFAHRGEPRGIHARK